VRRTDISCRINGVTVSRSVDVALSLADWLRGELNLTGTRLGCEHGICGSCTILANGLPVRSCLMMAAQADGADIMTLEGVLGSGGEQHALQKALADSASFQCGFCASGFVMSILGLVSTLPQVPDDDDIRDMISGNLCRCTGYASIVAGVRRYLAGLDESGEKAG
jgi:aerobic-type carbon monoxide dehydrogenase small subunit (CoxS/CutS family)